MIPDALCLDGAESHHNVQGDIRALEQARPDEDKVEMAQNKRWLIRIFAFEEASNRASPEVLACSSSITLRPGDKRI
jgi:hypothetical protein